MNTKISIAETKVSVDDEGFKKEQQTILATIHAYREGRHATEKWANRATFSDATDLFRFRCIPSLEIKTDMVILCDEHTFEITSVEDVKGRGMYIEVLGKEVKSDG